MEQPDFVDLHLERVRTSLVTGYSLANRGEWISKHTRLRGLPFSYVGHEFQQQILSDDVQELLCRKCSQVGLSEVSARDALAMVNVMPGFTVIYTLPTAAFSKTFARTRVDPIIQSSPYLSDRIHKDVNSGEVKQFGESFLYFRGTKGINAAISVPADCLVHDEYDFSDLDVLSNYQSRLTHSPYKWKRKFSTPTINGWGISAEFDVSKQHWNVCKCNHCNNHFIPDYEQNVIVPGWNKKLSEINSDNIHLTRWKEAMLICPKCGKEPDLSPEHRQWVIKNPDTGNDVHGYQVQPFDAPSTITVPYLVSASTEYQRYADFINFNLGLPAEDKETSFSREELEALFATQGTFTAYGYVMGIDMGLDCYVHVGAAGPGGQLDIIHSERVPLGLLKKRKQELKSQYKARVTVMDSQPYFDLLMGMQAHDKNLYGAVYSNSKDIEIYSTQIRAADPEKGRPEMRQIDISRSKGFDSVMEFVRSGNLAIRDNQHKESIIAHMMDMKRIKEFNEDNDLVFVWKKSSKGHDHWHHALLYTYMAAKLLPTAGGLFNLPHIAGKLKIRLD